MLVTKKLLSSPLLKSESSASAKRSRWSTLAPEEAPKPLRVFLRLRFRRNSSCWNSSRVFLRRRSRGKDARWYGL